MAKPIRSIGLFHEDVLLKAALIVAEKDEIDIQDLQSITFKEPETTAPADTSLEEALDGLDFDFGFDEALDQSDEDKGADLSIEESLFEEPDNSKKEVITEDTKSLEDISKEMDFENGTISMNLDFNQVIYKTLDLPPKVTHKKILSLIKKQFYDVDVPRVISFSYFQKGDGSYIGISHEKNMELLEKVIMLNRSISKKRYHYSYIQPNEVALINALRYNYSIKPDDVSAIIYLSKDNTRVLLTDGYDYLNDLPVINDGYESRDIMNTVLARIRLERTQMGVKSIENIFLAGEGLDDSMLEFIKNRKPECRVEYLLPVRICEQSDCSERYDEKTLASYIAPIMLAVAAALPKDTTLLRSNFLPKQLLEQQNIFSISTAGLTVLGAVLITGLVSINMGFQQQTANSSLFLNNLTISSQIRVEQTKLDSLFSLERRIAELEKNISRSNQLLGSKNQWHFIIERISDTFIESPLSWLTGMTNTDESFTVTGYTNNRRNIIELSKLFPEATIRHVVHSEVEDNTVWTFEVIFQMPDPLETKRLNYIREGLER